MARGRWHARGHDGDAGHVLRPERAGEAVRPAVVASPRHRAAHRRRVRREAGGARAARRRCGAAPPRSGPARARPARRHRCRQAPPRAMVLDVRIGGRPIRTARGARGTDRVRRGGVRRELVAVVRPAAHHRPVSLAGVRRGGARGPDEPVRRRQLPGTVGPPGPVRARVAHRRARRAPRHRPVSFRAANIVAEGEPQADGDALAAVRRGRVPRAAEGSPALGAAGRLPTRRRDRARDRRLARLRCSRPPPRAASSRTAR